MKKLFLSISTILIIPSLADSQSISGSYVASTKYGNIFCLDINQHNEKIEGKFEEVDFKQIVPIEKGIFKNNKLSFSVHFMVNKRILHLSMKAKIIMDDPKIFFGNYTIGKEKGDFILYSVQVKPSVCRELHRKK